MTARETALAELMQRAADILAAADARDALADLRDVEADERENATDRARLVAPPGTFDYGDDWPARRHAGLDRRYAKADRRASHEDRIALTGGRQQESPATPDLV